MRGLLLNLVGQTVWILTTVAGSFAVTYQAPLLRVGDDFVEVDDRKDGPTIIALSAIAAFRAV